MSGSFWRASAVLVVAGAAFAGCSGSPPETLTDQQSAEQVAQEKASLADEDQAEAEFQKSQRKKRR